MLRKFNISIDGKEYQVEMEEIGGVPQAPITQPAPATQTQEPNSAPAPAAQPTPAPTVAAGNDAMVSPMPGTILKILVQPGEQVQENQPLLILEAMKMENEVVAAKNGTVTAIHATLGQVVNAGDALITIN